MDHLITADESGEMEVHSTWLDWTMSLSQLFDHNDAEQITNTVHKIRDTTTGSFDASELLQHLDKLNEPFQSTHWTFSSPAAMIGIFLIIALLTFIIWKKWCTKTMTQPEILAPTAPPAVNPNVALQPAQPAPQPIPAPRPNFNFKKSVAPKSITIINSWKRKRPQRNQKTLFFYISFYIYYFVMFWFPFPNHRLLQHYSSYSFIFHIVLHLLMPYALGLFIIKYPQTRGEISYHDIYLL
jgi:hypothetical protein